MPQAGVAVQVVGLLDACVRGRKSSDYRDLREPCKTMIGVRMRLALKWAGKCFRTFLFRTIRHLISLL